MLPGWDLFRVFVLGQGSLLFRHKDNFACCGSKYDVQSSLAASKASMISRERDDLGHGVEHSGEEHQFGQAAL